MTADAKALRTDRRRRTLPVAVVAEVSRDQITFLPPGSARPEGSA